MKKIDLHIHTINTESDPEFNFSLVNFEKYVEKNKLDCIAITNHNTYSDKQFNEIKEHIKLKSSHKCEILPGIEIDVLTGHLLVIADTNNSNLIEEISQFCEQNGINSKNKIGKNELEKLLKKNEDNLLLIPHHDKKPKVSCTDIEEIGITIKCGEVSSPKKWEVAMKQEEDIVPLIFSDIRISDDMDISNGKHMYIDCEEFTINNLKNQIAARKISLSNEECYFDLEGTGAKAHFGLNVVLGKRASGKSTLLRRLEKNHPDDVYHIKQFSLIEKSGDFDNLQKMNVKNIFDSKLLYFENFIEKYILLYNELEKQDIDSYIKTLKKSAQEIKKDAYASLCVYEAQPLKRENYKNLETLYINSFKVFKSDLAEEYFDGIDTREILNKMKKDLKVKYLDDKYTVDANGILKSLKTELGKKSSNTQIEDIDLELYLKKITLQTIFKNLLSAYIEQEFDSTEIFSYSRKSKFVVPKLVKQISRCGELDKKEVTALNKQGKYIELLDKLVGEKLNSKEISRCFLSYETTTYNENGRKLSGGEQTDYVFGLELEKAAKFDVILIDEPESSFDNNFLHVDVCKRIKELSSKSTIFLATHNNTLGVSIKPDNFIFNKYDDETDGYSVFNEPFSSATKEPVLLSLMEGGDAAYEIRREIYETIRN